MDHQPVKPTYQDDVPTPNEVVLMQEMERMNALSVRMYASLKDLKRALKGEIGMSQQLDELGSSLFNGFLPTMWAKLAPQTEKPLGSWMDHYAKRFTQYDTYIFFPRRSMSDFFAEETICRSLRAYGHVRVYREKSNIA